MYSKPNDYSKPITSGGCKYEDTLLSRDSGRASGTGSLRSNHSLKSLKSQHIEENSQLPSVSGRLELAPPRTPGGGSTHRSSMYIEPSQESGTV